MFRDSIERRVYSITLAYVVSSSQHQIYACTLARVRMILNINRKVSRKH